MMLPVVTALPTADEAFAAGQWRQAIEGYRIIASLTPIQTVRLAVALARDGDLIAALAMLSPALLRSKGARTLIRAKLVGPLLQAGDTPGVCRALEMMTAANPENRDDSRLLASIFCRLGRTAQSLDVLDRLAAGDPTDTAVAVLRLQQLIQLGRIADAARIAHDHVLWELVDARLGRLALLALVRHRQYGAALEFVARLEASGSLTADAAALGVTAARDSGDLEAALEIGRRALAQGLDHATIRADLAAVLLSRGDSEGAVMHLLEAVRQRPSGVRCRATLAELLLAKGRNEDALPHLRAAIAAAPSLAHLRMLHARALKQVRDYGGAARELLAVAVGTPPGHGARRHAAAALNLAGRPAEAASIYAGVIAARDRELPADFDEGLEALWQHVERANIPQARLDWAWSLRTPRGDDDYAEWDRRARWGWLADRFIIDWLECRTTQAAAAMRRLADLAPIARFINDTRRSDGGLVIATAHVGPMFAGPLALELLDCKAKWLASTPTIASASFAGALISTADQTEAQVARRALQAIESGHAVAIAVDGAMHMAAPRIPFLGQEITYSSFAAKLAYRQRVASIFCSPFWEAGRLSFRMTSMPWPQYDENFEAYSARWRDAYLSELRECLGGEPENLRLGGGLWRHVI